VADRRTALGAALIYSLLPASVEYAQIGNPDHHAFLALIAASYLALSMWLHSEEGPKTWKLNAGLVFVRVSVTLAWSGSLLYLALGEGALLLAALVRRHPRSLREQAIGCVVTALAVAPFVVGDREAAPAAIFSASALSWLHLLFFCGAAVLCGLLAALESRRPVRGSAWRIARAMALGIALCGLFVLLPGVREALLPAASYLTASSGFEGNREQVALYSWLRGENQRPNQTAVAFYAGFAYLIPFTLLAGLAVMRDPKRRPAALILVSWLAGLAPLAVLQIRWGNDFAPAGSIGFALILSQVANAFAPRWSSRSVTRDWIAAAMFITLIAPVVPEIYRQIRRDFSQSKFSQSPENVSRKIALARFYRRVRGVTPETAGFSAPSEPPQYGIMTMPRYGHGLHYVSRRATPADNFGPQFNAARHASVLHFYASRSESEALEIARKTRSRYVMTDSFAQLQPATVGDALHGFNGSAGPEAVALGHFRLVSTAQPGRNMLGTTSQVVAYKLFEVVKGALLEIPSSPGTLVRAEVRLRTAWQQEFDWMSMALADRDGFARIRVPYATQGTPKQSDVQPVSSYRVRTEQRGWLIDVEEHAVQSGQRVRVPGDFESAG
jgi:asparagine N-glycosylation enzyme membrane subunit Stt3